MNRPMSDGDHSYDNVDPYNHQDRYDEGVYELEQELSPKELALESAIAANPDQEHYYFAITETGEHIQIDPNPEMCTSPDAESEPFLKRFMSGSRTRRDFNKIVAKGGIVAALGTFLALRTKSASAYSCWWQDDGLHACLANNCTQNNYRGWYKEQGYYCCNPSCHYTGSYRWSLQWCGC